MRPPSPVALTRRRVLGAAAAAAVTAAGATLAAGCTTGTERDDRRSGAGDRTGPAGQPEQTSPDVLLAAEVRAAEGAALALVQATAARHRGLRSALRAAEAGHAAHLALLADAVPTSTASAAGTATPTGGPADKVRVPGDQAAALRRVVRTEDRLATELKRQAFAAESGPFARVLGSMAAAAAQQAALLGGSA